jgi:hypothetical protein
MAECFKTTAAAIPHYEIAPVIKMRAHTRTTWEKSGAGLARVDGLGRPDLSFFILPSCGCERQHEFQYIDALTHQQMRPFIFRSDGERVDVLPFL